MTGLKAEIKFHSQDQKQYRFRLRLHILAKIYMYTLNEFKVKPSIAYLSKSVHIVLLHYDDNQM